MATFKTTYDTSGEKSSWETPWGDPQRVKISPGTKFESGKTYSPNVVNGEVRPIEKNWEGRAVADPQLSQSEALNQIAGLSKTPSWKDLLGIKEQLVGVPSITTDQDEPRNMYQYLINEMLRAGQSPRGAQLLDVSQIPLTDEGDQWRRTGGTTFTDPENPSFGRDLAALFSGENTGVFNLRDQDNEGLASLVEFQPGWAQGDPDKGLGLGITDWGELMEGLVTGATPLKYAKMMGNYIKDNAADTLHNVGVGSIETAFKPVDFLAEQIDRLFKKKTKK